VGRLAQTAEHDSEPSRRNPSWGAILLDSSMGSSMSICEAYGGGVGSPRELASSLEEMRFC
jgi:hypothetical protein